MNIAEKRTFENTFSTNLFISHSPSLLLYSRFSSLLSTLLSFLPPLLVYFLVLKKGKKTGLKIWVLEEILCTKE
jgi:hypothetical protein